MDLTEFVIREEKTPDAEIIDSLNAQAFGPARFTRAAHYLRTEGANDQINGHDLQFSFVAELRNQIIGSLRMTPVRVGEDRALLLGPIVVDSEFRNLAIGSQLMNRALEHAKERAFKTIILIGDVAYYQRFGFRKIPNGQVFLPLPVNPERVLALKFDGSSIDELAGPIHHQTVFS